MKKISKFKTGLSAAALLVSLAAASNVYADVNSGMLYGTYLGVDAVASKLKFEKDYGENIFSKKLAPGLNFFVGHMFHENFGAEVGFEIEKKMKRTTNVNSGTMVANRVVPNTSGFESYKTDFKQYHTYLGVAAKANLVANIFASLMVGGVFSHVSAKFSIFDNGLHNVSPSVDRSFSKTKLTFLVRGLVEQKFHDQFSVRALVSWKNTSTINMDAKEGSYPFKVKTRNSFSPGLGITCYL